ncbi:MAG: LemA family protein, partial [Spirochaetes bacterium]|nr:LemA family protein [Spirochaetota bacterium]
MALSKSAKTWIIIGAIILLLIIFASSCVKIRNNMVLKQEFYMNKWAQVEVQLQRRYDLIPNLVSTVKAYAKHEKEVFTQIAEARAKLAGATSVNDKVKAANNI